MWSSGLSAVATVDTAPAFPTLLPPYTAASELSTSRQLPAEGHADAVVLNDLRA